MVWLKECQEGMFMVVCGGSFGVTSDTPKKLLSDPDFL
jgi:hypothetical protein